MREKAVYISVYDDMSACNASSVAELLPQVSARRREQALRYKHVTGQFCCLKSWLMVEEGVEALRVESREPRAESRVLREWSYNEYGKPYVVGGPCFSISHCKEGIAVAVSETPVGIDIEGIRHAEDELLRRVLNEEEYRLVSVIPDERERDRLFTRLWTRKEAVLKCEGTGIQDFEGLQDALVRFRGEVRTVEREGYVYSVAVEVRGLEGKR